MRRLTAALVIPVLAILLAALLSPQAPGTEAATLPSVSEPLSEGLQPAVESVVEPLLCFLSRVQQFVSAWAVGGSGI